jgi:hypothetical protein
VAVAVEAEAGAEEAPEAAEAMAAVATEDREAEILATAEEGLDGSFAFLRLIR